MRKSKLVSVSLAMVIAFSLIGLPVLVAEVSQGKCIQFDESGKQIAIESYDTEFSKTSPYGRPTGEKEVFDVSGATIGIQPEPGDILRLAWVPKNNGKFAFRVMNVSKQDLRKK